LYFANALKPFRIVLVVPGTKGGAVSRAGSTLFRARSSRVQVVVVVPLKLTPSQLAVARQQASASAATANSSSSPAPSSHGMTETVAVREDWAGIVREIVWWNDSARTKSANAAAEPGSEDNASASTSALVSIPSIAIAWDERFRMRAGG
jgi:hypothetical protein